MQRLIGSGVKFVMESSGILLGGIIVALIWANVNYASYRQVTEPYDFLVNDVLICLFFFRVTAEIREAILPGGPLARREQALMPILATVGGVAVPALWYWLGYQAFNYSHLKSGVAIPCATDIAVSYLAARLVLGGNHPLTKFLLVIAVVDDAIGLVIIALFYPEHEVHWLLALGLVGLASLIGLVLNKVGQVKSFWPYLIPGIISWFGLHWGGLHTSLALVPMVFTMPHGRRDHGMFLTEDGAGPEHPEVDDTLSQLKERCLMPVEMILGAFGLVNAGVPMSNVGPATWLVATALVCGKPLGIVTFTYLGRACRLQLPAGTTFAGLLVMGVIAGIGLTVAIFMSMVSFDDLVLQNQAKMGAFLSALAIPLAFTLARLAKVKRVQ